MGLKKNETPSIAHSVGNELFRIRSGREVADNKVRFRLDNARDILGRGLRYFCGDDAQWLPEYDEIVAWLSDNQGKGLLCLGNCGRGKTLICQNILPLIFRHWLGLFLNTFTANDLNEHNGEQRSYDVIKQYKIISIDDVGTESEAALFGERHVFFNELVDECERKQKLLIVTTNLSRKELKERYGERTTDRLRSITTTIEFKGKSLRK